MWTAGSACSDLPAAWVALLMEICRACSVPPSQQRAAQGCLLLIRFSTRLCYSAPRGRADLSSVQLHHVLMCRYLSASTHSIPFSNPQCGWPASWICFSPPLELNGNSLWTAASSWKFPMPKPTFLSCCYPKSSHNLTYPSLNPFNSTTMIQQECEHLRNICANEGSPSVHRKVEKPRVTQDTASLEHTVLLWESSVASMRTSHLFLQVKLEPWKCSKLRQAKFQLATRWISWVSALPMWQDSLACPEEVFSMMWTSFIIPALTLLPRWLFTSNLPVSWEANAKTCNACLVCCPGSRGAVILPEISWR